MPVTGVIPEWLLSAVAIATVFTIMFDLRLAIVPSEFRWVVARPGLLLKSLFSVPVAVPALAWIVARVLDLPRAAEVGIMLMAISRGAPVAVRRSLGAGGHRSFAPTLQIAVGAGLRITLGIVLTTILALAVGHLLGGPEPATRTATAISSAARNPGLALLVATLNVAPPAINATVLAYLVIAALTVIPYVLWRRRAATAPPDGG